MQLEVCILCWVLANHAVEGGSNMGNGLIVALGRAICYVSGSVYVVDCLHKHSVVHLLLNFV
jgi:hypothetical protein